MKRDDSIELDLGERATFAAFARSMNLTRAARARNLSQPAVHARLRKLSEALGREPVAALRRLLLEAASGPGRAQAASGVGSP